MGSRGRGEASQISGKTYKTIARQAEQGTTVHAGYCRSRWTGESIRPGMTPVFQSLPSTFATLSLLSIVLVSCVRNVRPSIRSFSDNVVTFRVPKLRSTTVSNRKETRFSHGTCDQDLLKQGRESGRRLRIYVCRRSLRKWCKLCRGVIRIRWFGTGSQRFRRPEILTFRHIFFAISSNRSMSNVFKWFVIVFCRNIVVLAISRTRDVAFVQR